MKYPLFSAMLLGLACLSGASCGGNSSGRSFCEGGDTVTSRADLLTLVDFDGYSVATVRDPWDSTRVMATYLLVERTAEVPDAGDAVVIRVLVEKSLVYSGVHGGAVEAVGAVGELRRLPTGCISRIL